MGRGNRKLRKKIKTALMKHKENRIARNAIGQGSGTKSKVKFVGWHNYGAGK